MISVVYTVIYFKEGKGIYRMFKRKLWKRVLPIILSVAMVLDIAPVTALAAEYEKDETVEETALEEMKTGDESDDVQSRHDNVQATKDNTQIETENVSEDNNVTADEKTTTKESPEESSETKTQTADIAVDSSNSENVSTENENTAAALNTEIIVDENALQGYCNTSNSRYKYDVDKKVILVKYDEQNSDPFESLLTKIQTGNAIQVKVDGKINASLTEHLNYQWKETDGTNLAATVPTEAGDYVLAVTLDAVDNTCSKAEAKIPLTIAKRRLSIALPDAYVTPGTTVETLKANFNYTLNREKTNWTSEDTEDITETKTSYIDSVSLTVYNAYQTDTALADSEKFLEGTDYVVSVKPVLKQNAASNYAISKETVLKIKSDARIETRIEVVQKNPEEQIAKVYNKAAEKQINYAADIKDKLTISVKYNNKNTEEEAVLDKAAVTEVWFDAAKKELGEGAEFEPNAAGTYYLGFRYYPTGEDAKIYKECKDSDLIKVIVERAPLTLVPVMKSDAETFYTGMTNADVLKYADYKLLDSENAEVEIDRDTFWGVSYDDISATTTEDTTSKRQSYEPVFRVMRAEKDAGGSPQKDENGKEIWTENSSSAALEASKYCYRLVFTGKKAVYTRTGALSGKEISVNDSDVAAEDKNHTIVITKETLAANYVNVPVAEAAKTKLNVSGIVQQGFNTTTLSDFYKPEKLVSKIYDGEALYASSSRSAYKKAVVTSADGQEVAKDYDSAITYTWYQIEGIQATYDRSDMENPKQTGWEVTERTKMTDNKIPTDAGEYMLEIIFEKTGYETQTEKIYYRIDKQLLVAEIGEIPAAYKNQTISDYTKNVHYLGNYNIYIVPNNQYTAAFQTEQNRLDWFQVPFDGALNDASYQSKANRYKLNWYVEQAALDENDQPVKDENGKNVYTRLSNEEIFRITGADTYRLGVTLTGSNSNYTNYEIVYDAEMRPTPAFTETYHNAFANVAVYEEQIGTVAVTLEIDDEKLTTTKEYDGKPFYASENEAWEAIQKALTAKTVSTGEVIALQEKPQFIITDKQTDQRIPFDQMVYGGDYTVSLYLLSDTTYQFTDVDIEYTISKRVLTVTPALMEDIPAGTNTTVSKDGSIYNVLKTQFAGYIEADAAAFQYDTVSVDDTDTKSKILGFGAYAYMEDGQYYYNTLSATVSKAGSTKKYEGYIKYGTEYAVQLEGTLAYPYSRNYEVQYVRKTFQATRRGNATVSSSGFLKDTSSAAFSKTLLAQRGEGTTVTITPVAPVAYVKASALPHTDVYGNVIREEGNYFEFEIQAPSEFLEDAGNCEKYLDGFIYRSSIEAAGGYVLKEFGKTAYHSGTNECIVVFPVKEKDGKHFEIIWENGYTEQFVINLTNAMLEEDLTKAVAPKSLSFNSVNKKMAVGDEQQLDVKIKKAQINDVILIDYRVTKGQDVISVTTDDEKGIAGYVTALKPGKATITAVPVRLVNNVKTDIEGAKAATVTITVSDVAAPAIKKITAIDNKVTFTYTKPANGYRREVYILEGKKKAEDFEALIRAMNGGKWQGVFAVVPQYYANELLHDEKGKTVQKTVNGLSADKTYTLYVRNVSGIRTLADGSHVELSVKGAVKNFKTTKPQIDALSLYAKDDAENFVTVKDVALSNKTEQLYVLGRFSAKNIDEAADDTDQSWLDLPLDKAYKKSLVQPKLTYTVSSDPVSTAVSEIRDFRNYTYENGYYYKKTDIATVDKKGKVTLKGVGKVTITVKDETTGKTAKVVFNIHATADSIKAKNAKLAVGKGLYLSSLLTYAEGKTALAGMDYQNTGMTGTTYKPNLTISAEEVAKINNEGNFYLEYTGDGDYYIYAKKPNATCSIALNDGTLSASLKIQSTPIEPVKDFKITNIADDRFTISFSYPVETYLNGVTYRVDITDARGSLVDSLLYDADGYTSYDGKKKMFTKVVDYWSDKIVRLSKYNVSVTTLYADEASAKPVKKAVKTTDFPANYGNLGSASYGGAAVYVYSIAGSLATYNITLQHRDYLTSGNTYTLRAAVTDNANYRMTDTVTWKSTNPKVATVKAKAGTYTAQLNALKPGITEIEVTSKITKKVFARWPVFVKAVGNAETYYGDYEFTWEYPFRYDPYYTSGMEVLTLQNPVRVTASELDNSAPGYESHDYKWVKFTAPAYGRYQFRCTGTLKTVLSSSEKEISSSKVVSPNYIAMLEGETLYFKVNGAFTMEVSDYIKQGTSFTVEDGSVSIDSDSKQYIEFCSTGDNVYTFYSKELPTLATDMKIYDEKNNAFDGKKQKTWTDDEGMKNCDVSLSMGENIYLEVPAGEYTIYVKNRKAVELEENTKLELTDEVKEQWYTYTAAEDGLYTFQSKDATSVFTVEYYESLKDLNAADWNVTSDGNDFSGRMMLEAGQKIAFKMSASEAMTATIIVTPEIPVKLSVGEEKDIPVNADSRRWVTFTLPKAGRYQFSAVPTEADTAYDVNLRYYQNAIEENEITTIEKNELIVSDHAAWKPDIKVGDTVYVEITTNKEGTDAANVKVSLMQVTATELTIGEEQTITVKNGKEWWYTFTPPQTGNYYIVQSVVTVNAGADGEETDTHTLSAAWYLDMEHRSSSEKFQTVGTHDIYGESPAIQRLFKVSADDLGLGEDGAEITTTATIIVKELTATPLELNQPLEISLVKNERRWYSFTAPETNTYLFQKNIAEGSVGNAYSVYGNAIKDGNTTDMNTSKDFFPISLKEGQTIYIQEHENKGGPVTFTRSIDCVNQISGKVEETIPLTSDAPKYYQYTADADNYYMISYTTEPEDANVTLFYGEDIKKIDVSFPTDRNYMQHKMLNEDFLYLKVSTESETQVSVTLHVNPAEPLPLVVSDPKEITIEPGGTDRYTWCSFTAETAGRYFVSMSSAETDKTLDDIHMKCYSRIMDETETLQLDHYYEAGETGYFAVYNEGAEEQKVTMSVEKMVPAPIEAGEDGIVSVEEEIGADKSKGYLYKAPKTGIYKFNNLSDVVSTAISFDLTGNDGVPFTRNTKQIFLRENDEIYISAFSAEDGTAKFTIKLESEPQTLSSENEPATIAYDGQDWKLVAFTAEETAFYNFDIVYSDKVSYSNKDYTYYMNHGQIMWDNAALYSKGQAKNDDEKAVAVNSEFFAIPLLEGETGYFYIPSFSMEVTIEVLRFAEASKTVETLEVNVPSVHEFKEDRVWYVFDAPEDGNYELTFEWENTSARYEVKYYKHGLSQISSAAEYINDPFQPYVISDVKKNQRICLVTTKKEGSQDAKKLTVSVTKK